MKFKLLAGAHIQDGVTYRAGTDNDVVESDRNLVAAFANKFQAIGDPEEAAKLPVHKVTGAPGIATLTEGSGGLVANRAVGATERAKAALKQARLAAAQTVGQGTQANASREASKAEAQAIVDAARKELEEMQQDLDSINEEFEGGEGGLDGEDVTHDFPTAADNDLLVFHGEDGRYQVARANAPGRAISEAPMTKRGLEKFLGEQEGEAAAAKAPKKRTAARAKR